MISLHRLGHQAEEFHLNPDLIVTVEANPDTVITLTTGTKVVVAESPDRVVAEIRSYRVDVLSGALSKRRQEGAQPHGVQARRAAQGMLLSIDRGESDDAADQPDETA
ncbi:MAG: flagellar FlbD family protein [Solirubrobacteraceae bacterium]